MILFKVVNVYMGVTINIIDSWEVFKAAKTAVTNTTQMSEINRLASSRAVELQVILFILVLSHFYNYLYKNRNKLFYRNWFFIFI